MSKVPRAIADIERERQHLRAALNSIPSTKPKAIEDAKHQLEKVEEELRQTRIWLRAKARKDAEGGGPSWYLLGFLAIIAFAMATVAILLNANRI